MRTNDGWASLGTAPIPAHRSIFTRAVRRSSSTRSAPAGRRSAIATEQSASIHCQARTTIRSGSSSSKSFVNVASSGSPHLSTSDGGRCALGRSDLGERFRGAPRCATPRPYAVGRPGRVATVRYVVKLRSCANWEARRAGFDLTPSRLRSRWGMVGRLRRRRLRYDEPSSGDGPLGARSELV